MDFKRSKWPWDVHEPKVKHQGYLLKSGRIFGERSAKKRHVALIVDLGGAYLLIGGEGDEEIGSPWHLQKAVGKRKCIDLLVGCTIEERGDDRMGFAVRAPGRTYVFAAMGLEQKLRWVTRLKNAVATGIEQSARPDVLEDAHKSLEQQRSKNNGHHRATADRPPRWQESAGTTDEYVELVESPQRKPREEEEEENEEMETFALKLRERRLRSERGGEEGEGEGGKIEQQQHIDDDDDDLYYNARQKTDDQTRTPTMKTKTTGASWRDSVREFSDALRSSPNGSREFDFDKELDSSDAEELEDNPLRAVGPSSVSWTSPPPPPSETMVSLHPDAVRGFSPVSPVIHGLGSAGADSSKPREGMGMGKKMGGGNATPTTNNTTTAATSTTVLQIPGSPSAWGGSWDAVGQRIVTTSSSGQGGVTGKRLDYGGESLRNRTATAALAAKVAEEQARQERRRRGRIIVDRELAPGEINVNSEEEDDDQDSAGLPELPTTQAGSARYTSFTPVAFGA